MKEPKYFELQAKTTLDVSKMIEPRIGLVEPNKNGIYIVNGKDVIFHNIKK